MKVTEIFYSLQGEGPMAGRPAVFLRTAGCNLRCAWCDTSYAFDEGEDISEQDVAKKIQSLIGLNDCRLVVITGGEPLLQSEAIDKVIELLPYGVRIDFETNGTIYAMSKHLNDRIIHYIISPKLSNAGVDYTLANEWLYVEEVDWKFVVSSIEDLNEVKLFIHTRGIPHDKVWLMPECTTSMKHFNRWQDIFKWSVENGFNASPRLHVLAYNSKRGV